jgi:transposase
MEAYPSKVREQVLGAYDQGLTTKVIAKMFGVGPAWCRGVKQRLREHCVRTATRQKHGFDPFFDEARRGQLSELVERSPDATLAELKAELNLPVSITTIWRTLQDMKLTLKKSRCMRPSGTAPMC